MANDLKNLKINEVSFCKRGMNQHARISLFKSRDNAADDGNNPDNGDNMSDTVIAELKKANDETNAKLEKALAELAIATAVAKLDDEGKAYFAKASDEDKKKFLEMSDEDKKKKTKEVSKADETLEVAGQKISKSAVGATVFEVLKAQEAVAKTTNERLAKAEEAAEMAVLEKRAAEELKYLPGTDVQKASLLKSLGAMSVEQKTFAEEILKSANAANEPSFKSIGVKKGTEDNSVTARDAKISEIAKRDNVSKVTAMEKAIVESPELFK